MTIAELLNADEGKTLEFKQNLSSPRNLLKTLVAFANTAGGRIIIGVADKTREPLGIDNPLDEEERLCNLIADAIAPRLVPNIELATVDGKTLLIAEVFLSESRPHFIKAEGIEAGVYVRLGSPNRQADAQLIAELQRGIAGGGIPGIFRRVEAENLPEPTIEELAGRLRFTVPLAEILPLALEQSRKGESLQPGLESQGQRSEQVSEQVKVVLRACHIQARSKAELLRALGLANAYLNYKRHLLPLIEQGLIERTIPDKPNSRLQKYRLTDKGEGALAEKSAQAGEGPCNG